MGRGPDGAPGRGAEAAPRAPAVPAGSAAPRVPVPAGPAAPRAPVPVGPAVPRALAGPGGSAAVERGLPPRVLAAPASARPGPQAQAPGERASAGPGPAAQESGLATREPEPRAAPVVPVRSAVVVAPVERALPDEPGHPVRVPLTPGPAAREPPGCPGAEPAHLLVGQQVSARPVARQQGSARQGSVSRPSVGWPPARGLLLVPRSPACLAV